MSVGPPTTSRELQLYNEGVEHGEAKREADVERLRGELENYQRMLGDEVERHALAADRGERLRRAWAKLADEARAELLRERSDRPPLLPSDPSETVKENPT